MFGMGQRSMSPQRASNSQLWFFCLDSFHKQLHKYFKWFETPWRSCDTTWYLTEFRSALTFSAHPVILLDKFLPCDYNCYRPSSRHSQKLTGASSCWRRDIGGRIADLGLFTRGFLCERPSFTFTGKGLSRSPQSLMWIRSATPNSWRKGDMFYKLMKNTSVASVK